LIGEWSRAKRRDKNRELTSSLRDLCSGNRRPALKRTALSLQRLFITRPKTQARFSSPCLRAPCAGLDYSDEREKVSGEVVLHVIKLQSKKIKIATRHEGIGKKRRGTTLC